MRFIALLALAFALPAHADYEYRYLEGENFSRSEQAGLRDEGFTSWMAHPSHGKIVVFGTPVGGFVEYDIKALGEGPHFLYVRCLALSGQTRTHVLWDGRELGLVSHAAQGTALKWSDPLGPLTGPGDHVLRLQGSADTTQWPYIDTILLTNQPGYRPDDTDADFASFTTPFPPLTVVQLDGAKSTLAPSPLAHKAETAPVGITSITLGPLQIGDNDLAVAVHNPGALADVAVTAKVTGPAGGFATAVARVLVAANSDATIKLRVPMNESGKNVLTLHVGFAANTWTVTVPGLAKVALDEYAYDVAAPTAFWTATLSAGPELLGKLRTRLTLRREGEAKPLWSTDFRAAASLSQPVPIAKLGLGRYTLTSAFLRDGKPVQSDALEFVKYAPSPSEKWEPIVETKAVGDAIFVNGHPFLGRMLYHAAADANTAAHGFNLVSAAGWDPDPLTPIRKALDDCRPAGLYGAVALFNNHYFFADGKFDLAHIEQAVRLFKDDPAVWCWDLIDEPDGQSVSPETVQAAADLIRRLDGHHIVWVNLCVTTAAEKYLASQDLWSFDYYPLPGLTPFAYRTWLDISDAKFAGRRPMGSALQTYVGDASKTRMPTPDELRNISYLHLLHGYKFLGYYSYYDGPPAGCLERDPVLWSYTRALNAEHCYLRDAILAPGEWAPVRLDPATDQIQAREKHLGDKWYVIVVSNLPTPTRVKLRPSAQGLKHRLLFESDAAPVSGATIDSPLRPFGSHVYELAR